MFFTGEFPRRPKEMMRFCQLSHVNCQLTSQVYGLPERFWGTKANQVILQISIRRAAIGGDDHLQGVSNGHHLKYARDHHLKFSL